MSAIIHNSFRKYNADNFIASMGINKVYLMIGKNSPWSGASAGEYVETTPTDAVIPVPIDTTVSPYIHHADMIAAKLIPLSSVSHVIKRVNWVSSTVYVEYDHLQDDIIDTDFFVFTSAFRVYKCISNFNGAASSVEPTGVSTDIIETADNYRWKFMFEVPQGDVLKFVTSDWIPVKEITVDDSSDQWAVQEAAVNGAIDHIRVTDGGTGYKSGVGTAITGTSTNITLELGANATDDYYNGLTIFITSGTGANQLRTITDYEGSTKIATVDAVWTVGQEPNNTSEYSIAPPVTVTSGGIGTGSIARVSNVDGGVIKKIAMVSVGTNYVASTASVTGGGGTGAVITPIIAPPGGHGSNAVAELGGAFVMMNARLIGNEGADFPVGDDFRKVHLLSNPKTAGVLATGTTYNGNEIDDGTGEMIYTEFRTPINRASDSTEDIKLVVEF